VEVEPEDWFVIRLAEKVVLMTGAGGNWSGDHAEGDTVRAVHPNVVVLLGRAR
jgi:hypothetical protein